MSVSRKIWATPFDHKEGFGTYAAENYLPKIPPNSDASLYHRDDVVRELLTALAQAAVPLEGLTLAAHATGSNMGLCKGTWDEINNGVAHIRAALAKIAQEDRG